MEENITEEFVTFEESEAAFLEAEQEVIEAPAKPPRRRKKPKSEAICEPEKEEGFQVCPKVKRTSFQPPIRPMRRGVTKSKRGIPKIL